MIDWIIGLIILITLFMTYHLVRFLIFKKNFIPVLMYHRVTDYLKPESIRKQMHKGSELDLDLMKVSIKAFNSQMSYLNKKKYKTRAFSKKAFLLDSKSVYITFDDGYEDNYLNAFPILSKYEQTATIYLVSNLVGTNSFMPIDINEPIEENKLLSWDQIKDMYEHGICFGSHTRLHPWLNEISEINILKEEIIDSKLKIEKEIGKPIYSFAYPAGLYNAEVIELVKKHYTSGLATARGNDLSLFNTDLYQIEREAISRNDNLFMFKLKLWGIHRYIRKLKWLNWARRLLK